MGNIPASPADTPYCVWCRGVCVRSCCSDNGQGRQSASAIWQNLLLGDGWRCGHRADIVIRPAGLLPRYGCGVQLLFRVCGVSGSLLEGDVQRRAAQGSGLGGCGGNGVVEPAAVPHGFFAGAVDARRRSPDSRTHGEHRCHCLRAHRNAHGAGLDPRIYQALGRKNVLVVWPYARDDRQLHRGNDRLFAVNLTRWFGPAWWVWLWPTIVGVPVIAIWTNYYEKKFAPKSDKVAA